MRLAFVCLWASAEGRAFAVKTKETNMRVFSLPELILLTRTQLFTLYAKITEVIANPASSPEDRETANALIQNLRFALSRKPPCP
jgi:hypothetical protein